MIVINLIMEKLQDYDCFGSDDVSDSSDDDTPLPYPCGRCKNIFHDTDRGCSVHRRLCTQCHTIFKNEAVANVADDKTGGTTGGDKDDDESVTSGSGGETDDETTAGTGGKDDETETATAAGTGGKDDETTTAAGTGGKDDETSSDNGLFNVIRAKGEEWPPHIMRAFLSKEISIELMICGFSQCFVRKKFIMDPPNSVIQLYMDMEMVDKAPLLYDYLLLSAHFNRTLKQLVIARSVVFHKESGKKYIVLAVLRTKCGKPRYDAVLMDVVSADIFRLTGLTGLRQEYCFLTTQAISHEYTSDKLISWLKTKGLEWDRKRPNKLPDGSPDHISWTPPSRNRPSRAVPKPAEQPKPPPKPKPPRKRRCSGKNQPLVLECEDLTGGGDGHDDGGDVGGDEDDDGLLEQEALAIAQMKSKLKAKRALLEEKRKLHAELLSMENEDAELELQIQKRQKLVVNKDAQPLSMPSANLPLPHSGNLGGRNDDLKQETILPAPLQSAAAGGVMPPAPMPTTNNTNSLNVEQMLVIQNQADRVNHYHNVAMQMTMYENIIMSRK